MKGKIMSLAIAAMMMTSMAPISNAGAIGVEEGKLHVVVNNEFLSEDELLGYELTKGTNNFVEIADVPYKNDSSVKLTGSGISEKSGAAIKKQFLPQSGKVIVETRIMKDEINGVAATPVICDINGNIVAEIGIQNKKFVKKISETEYEEYSNHTGVAKKFWYSLKVILDTENKVYDVYADGRLLDENAAFLTESDNIASVNIGITGQNSGSIYVDFLKVYCDNDENIENYTHSEIESEDFSSQNPKNWNFTECEDTENTFVGLKDNAAVISNLSKTATAEHKITKTFANTLENKAVIEYDVTPDKITENGTGNATIGAFYDSAGKQIAILKLYNWRFSVNDETAQTTNCMFIGNGYYYGLDTVYHVRFDMDFDSQNYYLTITEKESGKIAVDKTPFGMRTGSTTKNLAKVDFSVGATAASGITIDNFSVDVTKKKDDYGNYYTVLDSETEKFESATAQGWTFSENEENSFAGIKDGMAYISNSSTTSESEHKIIKTFDKPLTDKVIVEYDFTDNTISTAYGNANIGCFYDSNGKQIAILRFYNWSILLNSALSSATEYTNTKKYYALDTMYHACFEMDLNAQKYYFTLTEKETGNIKVPRTEYPMRAGSTALDLSRIEYVVGSKYNGEIAVDNFTVTLPEPKVVSAKLTDGTDLRNAVGITYNTDEIIVKFSDAMDSELLENIMIKNMETSLPVAYVGTLDETKTILTMRLCESVFEKDTKYNLIIPESCASTMGIKIGNPEEMMFYTETEDVKVENLCFIDKNTKEEIKNYGDLTSFNGFAQISNYDTEETDAYLVLTVYDESKSMISCKTVSSVLSEYGDVVELENTVDLPADGKNYTVKLFVWYGTDNMKPVTDGIYIKK